MEELGAYLVFPGDTELVGRHVLVDSTNHTLSAHQDHYTTQWSRSQTLRLLDCYQTAKAKVGKQVITKKKLWSLIAEMFGEGFTTSQCENRWKVLERNFKLFTDNKRKTGRGRKNFEYAQEMEAIFGKKKNLHPSLLLSSDTVVGAPSTSRADDLNGDIDEVVDDPSSVSSDPQVPNKVNENKKKTRARYNVLNKFRQQSERYQEAMIHIQKQRLEVEKQRLAVLREKNKILAEKQCCCTSMSYSSSDRLSVSPKCRQ